MEMHGDITGWTTEKLAIGTLSLSNALTVSNGGTGAKNAKDARINLGLGDGSALPVGVPVPWPTATAPNGWLKCNGATFDKAKYPGLATVYPSGVLPDMRGEFIRGWDDGRNIDAGRQLLSAQKGTTIAGTAFSAESSGYINISPSDFDPLEDTVKGYSVTGTTFASGIGRYPIRPRNIAFNYIVRAA